jgi:hypothetical protein
MKKLLFLNLLFLPINSFSKLKINNFCNKNFNIVYSGDKKIKIFKIPNFVISRNNKLHDIVSNSYYFTSNKDTLLLTSHDTSKLNNIPFKIGKLAYKLKENIEVYNYKRFDENLYIIQFYFKGSIVDLIFKHEIIFTALDIAENIQFVESYNSK